MPDMGSNGVASPSPTFAANDEELGHIPDRFITREIGALFHECEARQPAVNLDDERIPLWIGPIKRKTRVFISTVRPRVIGTYSVKS
jgi:hypothetical protein